MLIALSNVMGLSAVCDCGISSSYSLTIFAPKWLISYFQPVLAAVFVTIATVKVKLIPDLYTWVIVLINQ